MAGAVYLVGFLAVLALIIGIVFRYTAAAERRGLPPFVSAA